MKSGEREEQKCAPGPHACVILYREAAESTMLRVNLFLAPALASNHSRGLISNQEKSQRERLSSNRIITRLGIKARNSSMPGKYSSTALYPLPYISLCWHHVVLLLLLLFCVRGG